MSTNKSFSTETSERYSRALFEVSKEAGELEKVETDKDFQNIGILLPRKKPTIIVKKTEPKKEKVKKSKYYNKKDVKIAQQSLDLIKRKKWQSAIKISSRAKDKSIYDLSLIHI